MITTFRKWVDEAFNSSIIEQRRHIWVDYLRGIVIILVVYHHAFLGLAKSGISVPKSIIDVNMAAYSFRMPLFFIFSGIFTSLVLKTRPMKSIVWSKFNLLLYPYLVWCTIHITLQIIFSTYTNSQSLFSEFQYILYQPKHIAHFWYLPALFNATVAFALVKTKFRIKTGHHLLLGIILFLLAPFFNSISMISNWMRFYVFLVIGDILSDFILKKETQTRLKKPSYFLGSLPLFVLAQYYYFNVIGVRSLEDDSATFDISHVSYIFNELGFLTVSLTGCATFIFLSFLVEKWNRLKWLRVVGFHSLYIYIMHVIVVATVRAVLTEFFEVDNYLIILITVIVLGVTIPIMFYNLIGKKYLWFLFSTRRDFAKKTTKINDTNIRSDLDLRVPPLRSSINNM